MRHIDIKAMLQRGVGFLAQVPFTKVAGHISRPLDRLRQRNVFRVQPRNALWRDNLLLRAPTLRQLFLQIDFRRMPSSTGESGAGRIKPRHDARSRG